MRPLALVVGVTTVAATVGLFVLLRVGPSLYAAAVVTAATFSAAGLACHRAPAGVVAGGTIPIVALAVTGVAFASLPWAGTLVAVATGFAIALAHARRARRRVWIAVAAWIALVLAGRPLIGALVGATAIERVARPIATFTLTAGDGRPLRSDELRGRVVVLAFWATWCEPCQAELPELAMLAARYRGDPRVALWWVNAGRDGDTLALARGFATDHHVALPVAFDGAGLADTLGITGLPALAILDAAGQLRALHRGYDRSEPLARTLGDEIDRLLAHP